VSIQITNLGPKPGGSGDGVDRLPSRAATVKIHSGSAASAGEEKGTILEIHPGLGRFTAANERLNALAAEARTAEKKMAAMSEAVNRMEKTLGAITKNFPPFPPGSEDRVKLLKSYAELRRQIAQLTIPPEVEAKHAERTDRTGEQQRYTFILQKDGMIRTIPREDVRFGPTGLVIPEVQDSSSDRDIQVAVDVLAQTAQALDGQRMKAAEDIEADALSELFSRKAHPAAVAIGTGFDSVPDEPDAQSVSLSVRDDLARMGSGFLHTSELRFAMQGA